MTQGFGMRGVPARRAGPTEWERRHAADPFEPAFQSRSAGRTATASGGTGCGRLQWALSCIGGLMGPLITGGVMGFQSARVGRHVDLDAFLRSAQLGRVDWSLVPAEFVTFIMTILALGFVGQFVIAVQFARRMVNTGQTFGKGLLIYFGAFMAIGLLMLLTGSSLVFWMIAVPIFLWGCIAEPCTNA